jgi:adenylosuccinate lyase
VHPIDYRYGSEEIKMVFSEENRLQNMLVVEVALVKSLVEMGKAPKKASEEIEEAAVKVRLERVKEIEKETKHDVMALVKALSEQCSPETAKYVHLTATSYDIVDTAISMQVKEGLEIIMDRGAILLNTLLGKAWEHKKTVMVGRTHGQHATPITLGFKLANYADKLGNDLTRLSLDMDYFLHGKFSGATGTYSSQKLYGVAGLEEKVMKRVGLKPADISTQVVGREELAFVLSDLAVTAGTLEQMAKEVRNLQRTEINELSEGFGKKQVGSSAMPQKRNPIDCENVCGNARVVRSCVVPAMENIALEHERDLTNSSCERSIIPTAFVLLDDMLSRMERVYENLQVFPKNMKKNLELTQGRIMAEAVVTGLVKKGMERQDAHELLRQASMESLEKNRELKDILKENPGVKKNLTGNELEELMDYEKYVGLSEKKVAEILEKWVQ